MIWDDGKIIFDIVVKAGFLGTKRSIWAEGIGPCREPRVPYGGDFGVKNGGSRLGNTYFRNIFPDILTS